MLMVLLQRCGFLAPVCYSLLMGEFIGRWVVIGGVCIAVLAATGGRTGGLWDWFLVGIWLGFWNAALRPLALRANVRGWRILARLLAAVVVCNGVLFFFATAWLPIAGLFERIPLWTAVGVASLCSWGLSVRFRAHDGTWHWLTYHGQVIGGVDRPGRSEADA